MFYTRYLHRIIQNPALQIPVVELVRLRMSCSFLRDLIEKNGRLFSKRVGLGKCCSICCYSVIFFPVNIAYYIICLCQHFFVIFRVVFQFYTILVRILLPRICTHCSLEFLLRFSTWFVIFFSYEEVYLLQAKSGQEFNDNVWEKFLTDLSNFSLHCRSAEFSEVPPEICARIADSIHCHEITCKLFITYSTRILSALSKVWLILYASLAHPSFFPNANVENI